MPSFDKRYDRRYEEALATVLLAAGPSLGKLEELERAASDYAITMDGERRILADIAAADTSGHLERAALLRAALKRGRSRREAARHLREMTGAPEPAPNVPAGMRAWSPAEPIWPKAEVTDEALRHAILTPTNRDLLYKAYRAIYATIWRKTFTASDGTPAFPSSDMEGWSWRKQVIAKTQTTITGAHTLPVGELTPGMIVCDNGTITRVSAVKPGLPMRTVTADHQVIMADSFYLEFATSAQTGPHPAATLYVRIPALESSVGS